MQSLVALLALSAVALGLPQNKLGNPDEWGPYYQGDIRLPLPKTTKNGLVDEGYRWPNGQVPYVFGSRFDSGKISTVMQAMEDYKSMTGGCITFHERTSESDYIEFIDVDSGCYSYVGKIGGKQNINYPQWCINQYGSVLHEMYHALGFFHEQSRFDRDDYVTIMYDNIQSGAEHNFDKYSEGYISGFGHDYDYGSVMHYSAYAFSANGEKTIVTTDPNASIGQRNGLSDTDLGKLMNMYKCN